MTPATPAAPSTPAFPVPPAITPNGTVVEDVVVRVNDQIISQSDVARSQQQLVQELQQSNATPADAADREKNMLRDMIDQQLLPSKAKALGTNADAQLTPPLDETRKQNKFETLEDLEKAVRQQGLSYEDFKANIRNGVITQQVVRDEVGRRLQMTQAQETAFYEAHKQEFEQPEQVRLSEILIPTPAEASEAQVAQAQAKANDVAAKLKDGAKFADLAKQYSGGTTAQQGGELGLFKRGALAKVLEDQTFPLEAGQSTAPIRTRQGFVVLKVVEHVKPGVPPMKDVEQDIQQAIYQEQMQPALRAYLTRLREEAYVDIRPGFVDSGASPKQTKIINSAYAPPTVKKKKNQSKSRYEGEFRRASVGPTRGDSEGDVARTPAPAAAATAAAPGVPAGTEQAAVAGTSVAPASSSSSAVAATTAAAPANNTGRFAREVSVKRQKVKKVHREKIRFGQAPRNALPAGPDEVATTNESGLTPGMPVGGLPAPATPQVADPEDPLAAAAAPVKKTRYSARAPQLKLRKKQAKTAKAQEKAIATPTPMTAEEKVAAKTQAAPLGLNGDTTKKKRKRKKGEKKERLQTKPQEAKPDKFANPTGPGTSNDLRKTPVGGTAPGSTTPNANPTTLPPATAPAPGAPVGPSVPGSTAPPAGSTTPAGTPQ